MVPWYRLNKFYVKMHLKARRRTCGLFYSLFTKVFLYVQTWSCHTEHRDCTLSKFPMPASAKSHFITAGFAFFWFPAVINLLSARFSTAGFAISYFPLLQTFFLPDFQQRDLHFSVFRCQNSSACPVFNSGIYIFLFSAVSSILLARFCEGSHLYKPRFELFYHEQHKCKKGVTNLRLSSPFVRIKSFLKSFHLWFPTKNRLKQYFAIKNRNSFDFLIHATTK